MHKRTFLAAPDEEETAHVSLQGKARGEGGCGLRDSVALSASLNERLHSSSKQHGQIFKAYC